MYVKLSTDIYLTNVFRQVAIDAYFFDQYVLRNLCNRLLFLR